MLQSLELWDGSVEGTRQGSFRWCCYSSFHRKQGSLHTAQPSSRVAAALLLCVAAAMAVFTHYRALSVTTNGSVHTLQGSFRHCHSSFHTPQRGSRFAATLSLFAAAATALLTHERALGLIPMALFKHDRALTVPANGSFHTPQRGWCFAGTLALAAAGAAAARGGGGGAAQCVVCLNGSG